MAVLALLRASSGPPARGPSVTVDTDAGLPQKKTPMQKRAGFRGTKERDEVTRWPRKAGAGE
jgi:hypothetical protein